MARPMSTAAKVAATPAPRPKALVASSARLRKASRRILSQDGNAWQREAYRHLGICGEARYAANFFANAMSRATLGTALAGELHRSKWDTSGPEFMTLSSLFPTPRAQSQMLKAAGLHLTVAGECYLIGRGRAEFDPEGVSEVWEIISVLELTVVGDRWQVEYANGRKLDLTEDDVVIRIWTPRADRRMEADSPFRAALPILNEIEWETRHIFTQLRSRLVGAGVWFLPQGLTFPAPPAVDGEEQEYENEAEAFMMMMASAGMEVLDNPDDPAYPITVMAPDEIYKEIDQGKLIKFWTELDEKAKEFRDGAITRFALSMDLPPEEILGMSGGGGNVGDRDGAVSHFVGWQIKEDTITMHIEPKLDVFVDALTVSFLIPLNPGTEKVVVYDTAKLRLRPDRSKESIELYDRGLLKGDVTLRENGFDPEIDGMDDTERKLWLLNKIASGSATPEMVQAALTLMGIKLPVPKEPSTPSYEVEQVPRPTPQPPALEEHPTRDPKPPHAQASALVAACEGLVLRALEKAGNRILNDGRRGKDKHREVEPHVAHTLVKVEANDLFDGAFSFAPTVLDGLCEAGEMEPILRDYCTALALTQTAHSRANLIGFLNNRGALAFPPPSDQVALAPQPIIHLHQAPIEITIPEREINMTVTPTQTPDIKVEVAAPQVTVQNDVPVPDVKVEVTNDVQPTPVEVKTGDVHVAPAEVTVNPEVKVEAKFDQGTRKTKIHRDENGDIVSATETDA